MGKLYDDKLLKGRDNYFGKQLRCYRKHLNLSADKAAELIGISTSYIGLLERGDRMPSLPLLLKVCKFFDVTIEEFLRDEKDKANATRNTEELELLIFFNSLNENDRKTTISLMKIMSERNPNSTKTAKEAK